MLQPEPLLGHLRRAGVRARDRASVRAWVGARGGVRAGVGLLRGHRSGVGERRVGGEPAQVVDLEARARRAAAGGRRGVGRERGAAARACCPRGPRGLALGEVQHDHLAAVDAQRGAVQ